MAEQTTEALSVLDVFKSAGLDPKVLTVSERVGFARKLTEYIGAATEKIDKYINKDLVVVGCVVHNATVKKEVIVDDEKTEIYENARRTVLMTKENGKRVPVGAVSMAVEDFASNILIPLFGVGDWKDDDGKELELKVHVGQVTKGDRRTYALQIL